MKTQGSVYSALVLAACWAACGDSQLATALPQDNAAKLPNPATPTLPTAVSSGVAGAAPLASNAPMMTVTAPTAADARAATPPSMPVTPTSAPAQMPEMGAMGAFPDACSERRASWGRPCTTQPDPCNLKSGYPGDEYCILPPPEGKGIQIHFGPKDYKNMDEVKGYLLQPGDEFNSYGIVNVPDTGTGDRYYQYIKISMRPGSHHLINNLISGKPAEGFVAGRNGCDGTGMGGFQGTQNLISESPPQGIPAPENAGLGRTLPNNVSICQNYHRYNTTEKVLLSEIWYNVWWIPEDQITQKSSGVMVNALFSGIPPGAKQVLTTTTTTSGDGRIISLFGHRHSHTERFAAWLNDQLIYDSWDWVESRMFNYDSITMNPAPAPEKKVDGAVSGLLSFKKGDKVKIECHVNNDSNVTLRFANELNTGEMCILFGATVGPGIN